MTEETIAPFLRRAGALLALVATGAALAHAADAPSSDPMTSAELAYIDTLDAGNAVDLIDSGYVAEFDGRDRDAWEALLQQRRDEIDARLAALPATGLPPADAAARAAIARSLASLDSLVPSDAPGRNCGDGTRRDLDYAALRTALVSCFIEIGNQLRFEGGTINRAQARTLLAELGESSRRREVFDSLQPLWLALNGRNGADSPYRRLIAMAAADAARNGSEIDAAARAVGTDVPGLERWLLRILEAWSEANAGAPIEPWDFTYVVAEGSRRLSARIALADLRPLNDRYYADLGADLAALGVIYDLAPRPDKSSVAYSDFVRRGREGPTGWQRPLARVVATYAHGGLGELNELVHESGHAVHVSAIRTRPAYMDWPESLFDEAFADVPSWSVYEPAWQQRYLGAAIPESTSLRALYGNVMLDVAWALFELRMLREPAADPNALWTDITHRYLNVVPHPEWPWWALRVQLFESPGYMVNYGLGAVLTAAMRERVAQAVGPFDAGNPRWYPWLSEHLLRYGSEYDTAQLMSRLLGRPVTPDALLAQLRRLRPAGAPR